MIVRSFSKDIKLKLTELENQLNRNERSNSTSTAASQQQFVPSSIEETYERYCTLTNETNLTGTFGKTNELTTTNLDNTSTPSVSSQKSEEDQVESKLDEEGHVKPYLRLDELDSLLNDIENRREIDSLCNELGRLINENIIEENEDSLVQF